jgi:hypothetical protein
LPYKHLSPMKTLHRLPGLFAALALACAPLSIHAQDAPPPPDQGDQSGQGDQDGQGGAQAASFQSFYDQLGDQGNWVQTDDYGYVFQPNVSDPNWAPYTDGHWVYTDDGWAWVSDEPWGWATYHYGRWANIDGTGWVWVPGYRWAPAWVSWRYGGGYCGWAPLPPESFVGAEYGDSVGVGFRFGSDVDVNLNIGPGCYNFVQIGDMGEPNYRGHYLDRSRNYTVINNTRNITNISVFNQGTADARSRFRGVSVGGPQLADVNAHSRTQVPTMRLTASNQPGRSTIQGNSLAVYAPRVDAATARTAKPGRVERTIAHPTFNRGDSITRPLAVNGSLKPAAPSAEDIAAAKTARAHVPPTAGIATEKTRVKTPITRPLTSMQPVAQTPRTQGTAAPANNFNGAKTASPTAERSAASSPFTGEAEKPATTHQPENQAKPEATATHPQAENPGGQVYHPTTTPVFHPQSENTGGQVFHPSNAPAPETRHEESHTAPEPAQTFHPQAEVSHPQPKETHEAPPVHTQPSHEAPPQSHAEAPHAAPHAAPQGKPAADDKKKQGQ